MTQRSVVPVERIEGAILVLRGHKVMLDADLAALYGVETKMQVRAVKRNEDAFRVTSCFRSLATSSTT